MNKDLLSLECQFNDDDTLNITNGAFICFTIIQDDVENTVCIDTKQARKLIKQLQVICNERLD